MGTYDPEKEIYRILQDASKIREYNAKLRSKFMGVNDEVRWLKVENSKLFSQNAYTETSIAKCKAECHAKSEEVKSLQSVINSLSPGYFDKNNHSNSHVKTGGEKNDEPEGINSSINAPDTILVEEKNNGSNSVNLETILPEPILPTTSVNEVSIGGAEESSGIPIAMDKLLSSMLAYSIILFLLIAIIWFIVLKKIWNPWKKIDRYIQTSDLHLRSYPRPDISRCQIGGVLEGPGRRSNI